MALDHEQTQALLVRYGALAAQHGPRSAEAIACRNTLVAANTGLVFSVWKRYFRAKIDQNDVLAMGTAGLIVAVERFDVSRGLRFSTFAVWHIRYSLGRTFANQGSTIRVPVHAQEKKGADGKCASAAQAARRVCSLDMQLGGEGDRTFADLCPDANALAAFDRLDHQGMFDAARVAVTRLPDREREVILARMADEKLSDIGARLGLPRERVRALEARALGRLRRALAA